MHTNEIFEFVPRGQGSMIKFKRSHTSSHPQSFAPTPGTTLYHGWNGFFQQNVESWREFRIMELQNIYVTNDLVSTKTVQASFGRQNCGFSGKVELPLRISFISPYLGVDTQILASNCSSASFFFVRLLFKQILQCPSHYNLRCAMSIPRSRV